MTPSRNRVVFEKLLDDGALDLERSPVFDRSPAPVQVDADRVEGMLLGLAVGTALAAPTEGLLVEQRHERYGEIRDYVPNPRVGGRRVGTPTVDSQLAFWTVEQLLADGRLDPQNLARRFVQEPMIVHSVALERFVENMERGRPWFKTGTGSSGNGALMRIAPVVLPHLQTPSSDLWVDAVLAGTLTHNDPASHAACVAFAGIIWDAFGNGEPSSWPQLYVELARDIEGDTLHRSKNSGYDYGGPIWRFVEEAVPELLARGVGTVEAAERFWSGAYLLETVPTVLYILAEHGDSFEEAVVRAVNDTWDNDTTAAIVGAVAGARHGKSAIPQRWLDDLSGMVNGDEGRIFELAGAAAHRFV